jgi:ribosome-associated heat shock protein Hsp15
MTTITDSSSPNKIRLDIWLWAARAFKTRSAAKAAIDGGKVSVNGQSCKAAKAIAVGDHVGFQRGQERLVYQVLMLSERRGAASVAAALFVETEDSKQAREKQNALQQLDRLRFQAPDGKPDKRDRRALIAFVEGQEKP